MSTSVVVPLERIQNYILVVRGQRVLLDSELAELYGVPTKRLNEQMKRNPKKFPEDFVFRLTSEEWKQIDDTRAKPENRAGNRSQFATGSTKHRDSRALPFAFTEHGAIQAANVLRSEAAVQMSVQVVRAFIQLRHMVVNHKAIRSKLNELDARIGEHDDQLAAIVDALRHLSEPVLPEERRRIGFSGQDS